MLIHLHINRFNLARKAFSPCFTSLTRAKTTGTPAITKEEIINNYTPIFRFPYIITAHVVCRLKLFQTALTVGAVPLSGLMYAKGLCEMSICMQMGGTCILACSVLYVVGSFFRKLIGTMYLNKEKDNLLISHLTFFGNRRDILVPVNDIVHFTDMGVNLKDLYFPLKIYSTGEKFYYIVKLGGVLKPEDLNMAIGLNISDLKRPLKAKPMAKP